MPYRLIVRTSFGYIMCQQFKDIVMVPIVTHHVFVADSILLQFGSERLQGIQGLVDFFVFPFSLNHILQAFQLADNAVQLPDDLLACLAFFQEMTYIINLLVFDQFGQ